MFADEERQIYRRGGKAHDPFELYMAFRKAQVDLKVDFAEVSGEIREHDRPRDEGVDEGFTAEELATREALRAELDGIYFENLKKLADLGRATFGVPALGPDGEGWTVREAIEALYDFIAWQGRLRGKADSSPSSSPATDGPPAS